jgi:hypothetical protein
MDTNMILKLVNGYTLTRRDIESMLYDICESNHATCNGDCPVYALNGYKVLDTVHNFKINRGCDCFRNGKTMFDFITSHKA